MIIIFIALIVEVLYMVPTMSWAGFADSEIVPYMDNQLKVGDNSENATPVGSLYVHPEKTIKLLVRNNYNIVLVYKPKRSSPSSNIQYNQACLDLWPLNSCISSLIFTVMTNHLQNFMKSTSKYIISLIFYHVVFDEIYRQRITWSEFMSTYQIVVLILHQKWVISYAVKGIEGHHSYSTSFELSK